MLKLLQVPCRNNVKLIKYFKKTFFYFMAIWYGLCSIIKQMRLSKIKGYELLFTTL